MKKPSVLFLGLIFIFILANSCDKSGEELTPSFPLLKKITTFQNDTLRDILSLQYDSLGRISTKTYSGPGEQLILTETYRYAPGKITVKLDYQQQWTFTHTLHINEKGQLVKRYDEYFITEYHEYNPQGYRIRSLNGHQLVVAAVYKIEDGNTVLSTSGSERDPGVAHIEHYTFLPQSVNTIGNENMGITFYGKQDKNLVSVHISEYFRDNQSDETTYDYEYEMDALHRVTKRTILQSNKVIEYTTYEYWD